MDHFGNLMFTPAVISEQKAEGSYETYARMAERPAPEGLGDDEAAFLASRTSIYMATVSETGWPYIQHRGGPEGFIKVLDRQTIGFADYRGNRQLISAGNLRGNARVSLFAMDYPRKARLKLAGHAAMIPADADPDLATALAAGGAGRVRRLVRIRIEAFDWNCPQFITPRFDTSGIAALVGPELERLEAENAELRSQLDALRSETERESK